MAPISSPHFPEPRLRDTRAVVEVTGTQVARVVAREVLSRRALTVTGDSQEVTLGIIAVYVVVIAILWNVPYVKWSLWPFKVCAYSSSNNLSASSRLGDLDERAKKKKKQTLTASLDACHRLSRV